MIQLEVHLTHEKKKHLTNFWVELDSTTSKSQIPKLIMHIWKGFGFVFAILEKMFSVFILEGCHRPHICANWSLYFLCFWGTNFQFWWAKYDFFYPNISQIILIITYYKIYSYKFFFKKVSWARRPWPPFVST